MNFNDKYSFNAKYPGNVKIKLWLKATTVEEAHKYQSVRYYNMLSIPEVLEKPTAIFKGLGRENFKEGLCYCGKPNHRYWDHTTTVPFPDDKIFLVFANSKKIIFDWRTEKEDHNNPGFPNGYATRFDDLIWTDLKNISLKTSHRPFPPGRYT